MRLDSIHIILKEYIAEQEKLQCRWPCDAEYDVPTWDNIYDALEAIESINYYEPPIVTGKHIRNHGNI